LSGERRDGSRRVILAGHAFEIQVLDLAAAHKDQDRHLVTDGFIGVADGATPLVGAHPPMADPGPFAGRVLAGLRDASTEPLEVALRRIIDRESAGTAADPRARTSPSCTVAVVRGYRGRLEAAVLGDCEVIVLGTRGIRVVSDAHLRRLDRQALAELRRQLRTGVEPSIARRSILPLLRRHRASMNQPTTYWVVAQKREAAGHLRRGWFSVAEARAILVASDGFLRLVDVFGLYPSRAALLMAALALGLDELGDRLRSLERSPGSARTYPRFADEDDVTAVLLRSVDLTGGGRADRAS
jgi:hypothetical protein